MTCMRDELNKDGKASALGLANIGGVFVVLLAGLTLALVTAIAEFVFKAKKLAIQSRVSISVTLISNLQVTLPVRCL